MSFSSFPTSQLPLHLSQLRYPAGLLPKPACKLPPGHSCSALDTYPLPSSISVREDTRIPVVLHFHGLWRSVSPTIPETPWELGLLQYIEICVSTMPGSVWVPNVLVSIWYACTVAMCVTSWCCEYKHVCCWPR